MLSRAPRHNNALKRAVSPAAPSQPHRKAAERPPHRAINQPEPKASQIKTFTPSCFISAGECRDVSQSQSWISQPAKSPYGHATIGEIFVPIAKMAKLPIKYRCQMPSIGHHIADTQITVHHAQRRGRRQVCAQPSKAQRNQRPIAASIDKLRNQTFNAGHRLKSGQKIEVCRIERMNARHRMGYFFRQRRRRCQDSFRIGAARNLSHDKANPQRISRLQLNHNIGSKHAAGTRAADQRRFARHRKRARANPLGRRRAAQHKLFISAGKQPSFKICAA